MKFKTIYLWYGLPAAIVMVWVAVFFIPVSAMIGADQRKLVEIKTESERIDKEVDNILTMRKRGKQAYISFHEFEKQFPVMDRLPEYMRDFAKRAGAQGLSVEGIYNVLPTVEKGGNQPLVSSVFIINVKGRFLDMGRFIEQMVNMPAFREILLGRIWLSEKDYPKLSGSFVVEFKALKGALKVEAQ